MQVVDEHFIDLKNAKGVSDSRPKFSKVPYLGLYVFVFIYYMFIFKYAHRLKKRHGGIRQQAKVSKVPCPIAVGFM